MSLYAVAAGPPRVDLQFEGVVSNGALRGLAVAAELVTVRDKEDLCSLLPERWRAEGLGAEGRASFRDRGDGNLDAHLAVVLFVNAHAIDAIYRVFANGFHSRAGSVGVQLTLDAPGKSHEEGFWEGLWREEMLRIAGWHLGSGATLAG